MNDSFFQSSDTGLGAPLKHARQVTFEGPWELELGGRLGEVTVTYETYGTLAPQRDNAVLVCHALSGDSHVARHDDQDDPGWWDLVVGPGRAIDTDKYFVVCPNVLGGCRGTTGPNSVNPATGKPYGADFPTITIGDMVAVQVRLIEHLGIDRLLAVVGGSMGGHQVLCWASHHSEKARGVIPIATSPRLSSQALAFDVVGRNAILQDPDFAGGQYYDRPTGPRTGLAIARMIGHITYLSPQAMEEKFQADRHEPRDVPVAFEKKFSVGSYLGYKGSEFVERFDANSYVAISMAMDLFDLGHTPAELQATLGGSGCRFLVISYSSDWLFSAAESRQIVDALIATDRPVSYCNVLSTCGHDAFLLADELNVYGGLIEAFLARLNGQAAPVPSADAAACGYGPTSVFSPDNPQRLDFDLIADLVSHARSVLDLGCGTGQLLSVLRERGRERLVGLELDEQAILSCVCRGLDVVHADLNNGLAAFGDKQFDCVILSRTLQAVRDVKRVMDDMLRVGRQCVVSFPNFGYHKLREMLYDQGRAPSATGLLHHNWYDSPNIRFFTIADFEDYCRQENITIHRRMAMDTERGREVFDDPNYYADLAIFLISR